MWRAYAGVGQHAWREAKDMSGAQVAAVDYAPGGWPETSYTIIRRVRIDAKAISADPDPGDGAPSTPTRASRASKPETVRDVLVVPAPAPHRHRREPHRPTEPRPIREAKLGAGLRQLPSAHTAINTCGCGPRCWPAACRCCCNPDRHR